MTNGNQNMGRFASVFYFQIMEGFNIVLERCFTILELDFMFGISTSLFKCKAIMKMNAAFSVSRTGFI